MIKNYTNGTETTGIETIFNDNQIKDLENYFMVTIPAKQKIYLLCKLQFNNLDVIAGNDDTYYLELGRYRKTDQQTNQCISFSQKLKNTDIEERDPSDKYLFKGTNLHTSLMATNCPFFIINNLSNNELKVFISGTKL